jgi:hypothetical protein
MQHGLTNVVKILIAVIYLFLQMNDYPETMSTCHFLFHFINFIFEFHFVLEYG